MADDDKRLSQRPKPRSEDETRSVLSTNITAYSFMWSVNALAFLVTGQVRLSSGQREWVVVRTLRAHVHSWTNRSRHRKTLPESGLHFLYELTIVQDNSTHLIAPCLALWRRGEKGFRFTTPASHQSNTQGMTAERMDRILS